MKLLYSWLRDYIALPESPEKLAEILTLYAFESSVDRKLEGDAVLNVELFPNRVGDAASHYGIARELGMILGRKAAMPKVKIESGKLKTANFVKVKVDDPKLCPRYSARLLSGIKVGQSPQWLKKRLAACGLRPINNIVDITNYVMLEIGEPLHAFDFDKLSDRKQITVRRAKKSERIDALDDKTYRLESSDLVIADTGGALAIAGIKGGKKAQIDAKTKTVVLEAANFDPVSIRKTAKRLGLRTDSSWRFENGIDPNLTAPALDRAAELIRELCGGEIAGGRVDFYPKPVVGRPVVVDIERVGKLIGEKLFAKDIIRLLKPILIEARALGRNRLFLRIRTERRDIEYSEDIAEEIARLKGYENLHPVMPFAPLTLPAADEAQRFGEIVKNHLIGLGFDEVKNYALISEKDADAAGFVRSELIELANPVSVESKYLARALIPNLLKNVRDNFRFFPSVRIFELSRQFRWRASRPEESPRLGIVLSAKGAKLQDVFFEAKGVLDALFEALGLDKDDYRFSDLSGPGYVTGAAASIFVDGEAIGGVGLVSRQIAHAYDIADPVAAAELDPDKLRLSVGEEHEFEPFHKYPDIIRDISFIIGADRRVEELQAMIHAASPKNLEDIDLFDVYEGPELGENKQSLAFHLVFRAPDRTLTDREVNEEMQKIIAALKQIGAEIR